MSNRIEDLEPDTRRRCIDFLARCEREGIPVRVAWTLRSNAEQEHMYAKGRTIPGEPCHHSDGVRPVGTCPQHPLGATVTRARAGESPHNQVIHGLAAAFDICFRGGEPYPPENDERWKRAGVIGTELGLSWGGPLGADDRFVFDRPHFERVAWKAARA